MKSKIINKLKKTLSKFIMKKIIYNFNKIYKFKFNVFRMKKII